MLKGMRNIFGFFLLCNIVLLVFFLIDVFFFYHVLFPRYEDQYKGIVIATVAVGGLISFINMIAVQNLLYVQTKIILIPILWKIIVPLTGFLLYLLWLYYTKYQVYQCRIYMLLIPAELLSMVVIALGLIGIKCTNANLRHKD